jgi:uncharacterized OsmC-like protein
MSTTTETPVDNGVNLQALLDAREALGSEPDLAQFQWRVSSTWKWGTHSQNVVEKFTGLGGEQAHHTTFTYDVDHPEQFASEDIGATPVEYVLVGLAGCLTAGIASIATLREIQLRSVTATLEGDMDLQGTIGVDPTVRNGFNGIRVRYTIDADASQEDLEALVAQSQKRSAVFDIIANPTNVSVEVNK